MLHWTALLLRGDTTHTHHLLKESQFTQYVRSINSCLKSMNCYHSTRRRNYALCSPTLPPLDHIRCPVKNDFNLHLPGLTVPPGQSPHSAHAQHSGLCTDACQASQTRLEDKMPHETTMSLYVCFFLVVAMSGVESVKQSLIHSPL